MHPYHLGFWIQFGLIIILTIVSVYGITAGWEYAYFLISPVIGMSLFLVFKVCFHRVLHIWGIAFIALCSTIALDILFPVLSGDQNLLSLSFDDLILITGLTLFDTTFEEVVELEVEHIEHSKQD